ncbi:hypothetical protein SAMN02745866_00858 [Alteromonadaceae bacterium Bs31]|nr:hypothetical protein SAMN02745866_00858 [Alteromonadaceae bacterium Bs31]
MSVKNSLCLRIILFTVLINSLLLGLMLYWQHADRHKVAPRLHKTIFQNTIDDAARVDSSRIVYSLFALNEANPLLIWQDIENETYVKVAAWMSKVAFNRFYAEKDTLKSPPENIASIWVTLVPQVKNFCENLTLDNPRFRLQQYLGLNPNRSYDIFVELWVKPEDIFRPCPDPEPSDQNCQLSFSETSTYQPARITDYPAFFEKLKQQSYQKGGAPWTRLGYTYDWQYGEYGVGASEYIISPDSDLYIAEHYSTSDYCQPSKQNY